MKLIEQSARCVAISQPLPGILFEPTPERLIEYGARICYKSEDKVGPGSDIAIINGPIKTKAHLSVVEHVALSYHVITDRGVSHEAVRMRLASYSQESTRYVNYSKDRHGAGDIQFILPEGLNEEQHEFAIRAYWLEQEIYNEAIRLGMTPQQAREFLPCGAKTEFLWTTNAREWLHIVNLRTDPAAHPKMRRLMSYIAADLEQRIPVLFEGKNKAADLPPLPNDYTGHYVEAPRGLMQWYVRLDKEQVRA